MAAGHAPSPPAARDRSPPRPLRPAGPAGPDHGAGPQLGETPASIVRPVPGQFAVGGQQQGGVAAIAGVRDHRRQQRRAQPAPCCGKATDISSRNNDPSMGSASANPPGWPSASATHSSPAACAWRRTSAGKVSPSTAQRMGVPAKRAAAERSMAARLGISARRAGRTVMGHRVCRKARPPAGADGAGQPAAAAHPYNQRLPAPAAASTRIHP